MIQWSTKDYSKAFEVLGKVVEVLMVNRAFLKGFGRVLEVLMVNGGFSRGFGSCDGKRKIFKGFWTS